MKAAPPIARGVGLKPYRPRKAPSVALVEGPSQWEWAVLVFRTDGIGEEHARADRLACAAWPDSDLPMPEPQLVWVRDVPWDCSGQGCDRSWEPVEPTTKGAVPALQYVPRHGDLVALYGSAS